MQNGLIDYFFFDVVCVIRCDRRFVRCVGERERERGFDEVDE